MTWKLVQSTRETWRFSAASKDVAAVRCSVLVDPHDVDQRQESIEQVSNGADAQSTLDDRGALEDHVVVRDERARPGRGSERSASAASWLRSSSSSSAYIAEVSTKVVTSRYALDQVVIQVGSKRPCKSGVVLARDREGALDQARSRSVRASSGCSSIASRIDGRHRRAASVPPRGGAGAPEHRSGR